MASMKFGGVLLILAIGCGGDVPADGGMQRMELGPKKAGKTNPAAIQDDTFRPDPAAIQDNSFRGIQDNTRPAEKVPPIAPAIDPAVTEGASKKKDIDNQKAIHEDEAKSVKPSPADVKHLPR